MKHRRKGDMPRLVIIYVYICFFLLLAFEVYAIWSTNQAFDWKVPFPEGTQILYESDTHRGVFRRKGTAVMVAKIPEAHIPSYGDRLLNFDFSPGCYGLAPDLLKNIEAAADILDSENALCTYQDAAIAFVEEPFSDWFAAIYDLDTGLLCYMEYDE